MVPLPPQPIVIAPRPQEAYHRPCVVGVLTDRRVQHYFPCTSRDQAQVYAQRAAQTWLGRV